MRDLFGGMPEPKGLPPGTLVHVGERRLERVTMQVLDYDEAGVSEKEAQSVEDCLLPVGGAKVSWINVNGLHDLQIVERLGSHFSLHPLVQEDIVHTGQRPKVEDYESCLYCVAKMLSYNDQQGEVEAEQVSLILGSSFLISFQERDGDVFDPVRERIRNSKGRIRKAGADYLLYSLLDGIVDGYFAVLEKLGEKVEDLQEEVVADPTPSTQREIHALRRELILFRKSVWPLREAISALQRRESPLICDATAVYFRDLYDHTIQVMDTVETLRDMSSGILDTYLASISNRMNEVMKVLTIMATLFMPLTMIAGIYGMNFDHMPELHWRWGYPAVLLIMIGTAVLMVMYFRRRKWI